MKLSPEETMSTEDWVMIPLSIASPMGFVVHAAAVWNIWGML